MKQISTALAGMVLAGCLGTDFDSCNYATPAPAGRDSARSAARKRIFNVGKSKTAHKRKSQHKARMKARKA